MVILKPFKRINTWNRKNRILLQTWSFQNLLHDPLHPVPSRWNNHQCHWFLPRRVFRSKYHTLDTSVWGAVRVFPGPNQIKRRHTKLVPKDVKVKPPRILLTLVKTRMTITLPRSLGNYRTSRVPSGHVTY